MPPARRRHLLSKTRYLAGLQCPKRLWLSVHRRDLGAPTDAATQATFDLGHRIGRRAHALFPGGVEIADPVGRHAAARAETRALLADPAVPAIFEAVFEHAGVRVHVDALERLGRGAFGLREVKASTKVKDEHLPDVAVQRFVLRGEGVRVTSVELVHVDRDYVRGADGIEPARLFRRTELSHEIRSESAKVAARVAEHHAVVAQRRAPDIEPGPHCWAPHGCEFWEHCTRGKPADWIWNLPGITSGGRFERLRARGIERIAEIPDDFDLTELQARIRRVERTGHRWVSSRLAAAMEPVRPPVLALDFETIAPSEPLYEGTRPYEALPFQWSLHRVGRSGGLAHREFLADERGDPRRAFAESLLEAAGSDDVPIVVWSSYESTKLRELASALPDLAPGLDALRARLVDLLPIAKQHVYDAGFRGSFSIKAVAPALAPGFGWDDLAATTGIADGATAAAAFEQIASGAETDASAVAALRAALLAYCKRDTEALVAVHRALRALAAAAARR